MEEFLRHLRHKAEAERHEAHDGIGNFGFTELNFTEEALRHTKERLLGPRLEPIDDGGVDHRQEALGADAELFTNRRAREHHVEVRAHLLDEETPNRLAAVGVTRRLRLSTHGVDDVVHILGREEVRNLTG